MSQTQSQLVVYAHPTNLTSQNLTTVLASRRLPRRVVDVVESEIFPYLVAIIIIDVVVVVANLAEIKILTKKWRHLERIEKILFR